jgi:hypothetical protein
VQRVPNQRFTAAACGYGKRIFDMKSKLIAAALVTGLASPAAASTILDFTSSAIGTGSTSGSVANTTYNITAGGGSLTDALHFTNAGCPSQLACAPTGEKFDVGFGVSGKNDNEIDGINANEYVEVSFGRAVRLLGFAGMLTYSDSQSNGFETVDLWYSSDGGSTFSSVSALPQKDDNEPTGIGDDNFGTVGLAFRNDLFLRVDTVRFYAGGTNPFDDGNANITAAGLEVAPVPLPAAGWMLLAGLGGMAALRRRQKS